MSLAALFHDPALYTLALTHRSLAGKANNQRLEFLGDRVLGLVIADMLYQSFPDENEGDMAKRHAGLVCGETLADVARMLELGENIQMAPSESHGGGRDNDSNLEDACEALIGALYLDGGLAAAEAFIREHWQPLLDAVKEPPKDAKTTLQEWAQARGYPVPDYTELARTGPDHAPVFTIEVSVSGITKTAKAKAGSKRSAERMAASALLEALT